jgi:hypothetical protein
VQRAVGECHAIVREKWMLCRQFSSIVRLSLKKFLCKWDDNSLLIPLQFCFDLISCPNYFQSQRDEKWQMIIEVNIEEKKQKNKFDELEDHYDQVGIPLFKSNGKQKRKQK